MRHKAWLARRSPPRFSRWRSVRPEEAGMGAVPHRCAKAGSERSRWGLSPAVTRSCPAVSIPTPGSASRVGDRGDQGLELAVELVEFALELPPAPGQGAQGGLGRCRWTGQGPGPQGRTGTNQGLGLEAAQRLTQLVGGAVEHPVELFGGRHPGFEGAAAGHSQQPDHLDLAVAGLGIAVATPARVARAAAWASIGSDLPWRRRVLRSGRSTSTTWRP
jgi:hypothetical protein